MKRIRFTEDQLANLTARYNSGMRGIGKQYASLIEAVALDTSLSTTQVEVWVSFDCNSVILFKTVKTEVDKEAEVQG